MKTITEILYKYRGGSPTAYYEPMRDVAFNFIDDLRRERSVSFVSHAIQGRDRLERMNNVFSLADTILHLSIFTTTFGFNQLYFHADFNLDDPRDFDCKFEVFYKPVVAYCDQLLAMRGYEGVRGCETEVNHARAVNRPRYLLNFGPLQRDQHWVENYAGELALRSASQLGWARAAADSELNVPFSQLVAWQDLVVPLP